MTETTFWQALRKKLGNRVYALKLNLRFVKGVPDCWLSGSKRDIWLELKYVKPTPPVIRPEKLLTTLQQDWLIQRHDEGRWVGALIGSPDGHLFFPGLSWQCEISREDFVARAVKTSEAADQLVTLLGERVLH